MHIVYVRPRQLELNVHVRSAELTFELCKYGKCSEIKKAKPNVFIAFRAKEMIFSKVQNRPVIIHYNI